MPSDQGEKARRRAARRRVGEYHEAELAGLLEHVRDGFARFDSGDLDAFELDDLIHHYKRAARELWKFCVLPRAESVASLLNDLGEPNELPDWWEAGRPRRRSGSN